MIKIRCLKKSDLSYTILVGNKYQIGRKNGDITFGDDQSISRNHAELTAEHSMASTGNKDMKPSMVIVDVGSKFGTFVKDGIDKKEKLQPNQKVTLHIGDRMRFGLQWNEFKFDYSPLIITTSTLKNPESLKQTINKLGGHLVGEWVEGCEYVVMDQLTLTIKAVCAILAAKNIVTPKFFVDYFDAVKSGAKKLPPAVSYIPQLAENQLAAQQVSFRPDKKRTKLFNGKIFLFANQKHAKKLGIAIQSGGGKWEIISSVNPNQITNSKYVIIPPGGDPSQIDSETKKRIDLYTAANKRLIQESEVGLAAVYKSIEKHCNPDFNFNAVVAPKLSSQTQQHSSNINLAETQMTDAGSLYTSKDVIEESYAIPTPTKSRGRPRGRSPRTSPRVKEEPQDPDYDVEEEYVPSTNKRRGSNSQKTTPAESQKRARVEAPVSTGRTYSLRKRDEDRLSKIFNMDDDDDDEEDATNDVAAEKEIAYQPPSSRSSRKRTSDNVAPAPAVVATSSRSRKQVHSPMRVPSPTYDIDDQMDSPAGFNDGGGHQDDDSNSNENDNASSVSENSRKRKPEDEEIDEEPGIVKKVKFITATPDGSFIEDAEPPKRTIDTILQERARKFNIDSQKIKVEPTTDDVKVEIKPVPVEFVSMVKNIPKPSSVIIQSGRNIKNFKNFIKSAVAFSDMNGINPFKEFQVFF